MARPQIQLSEKTLVKIAEALFLAYTAEQAAYLGKISKTTLDRIRKTELWVEIERKALEMEKPYRRKIYRGEPGWQGAAWMLERKYASQLSKPEVQLSLNTGSNVTNNTLVITAEQAQGLRNRNANLDQELQKLVPPGSQDSDKLAKANEEETRLTKAYPGTLPNKEHVEKTLSSSVVLAPEGAAPTGTPDAGAGEVEPNLPPKSKILRPLPTEKKPVGIDRNYRPGIDPKPPGKPGAKKQEKNLENFNPPRIEKPQSLNSLAPLQSLDKKRGGRPRRGTENVSLPPAPRGPKAGRK